MTSNPDENYLRTTPGTQMEWSMPHRWSLCRICRIMARLRLWSLRDRHIRKRHTIWLLSYVDGPR
jgi:hypothetical protein